MSEPPEDEPPVDDAAGQPGIRKDGKPYASDNTRDDGSYQIGYQRPPAHSQFARGDNRKRGKRARGTRNLLTEWREELAEKVIVRKGDKTSKISKRRGTIRSQIDRAIKGSDRAAENVLRYAELSEKRDPRLQADDHEIIDAWLQSMNAGDSDDGDPADA